MEYNSMLIVRQQNISRNTKIVILMLVTIASDLKVTEEEITHCHFDFQLYAML